MTEEKALKKIAQDRARNDLKRACQRALEAFERWPDSFDLGMESIRACVELGDNHRAVSLLKKLHIRHGRRRSEIEEYALDVFRSSFNPFLGSFLIELRSKRRDIRGIQDILRQASPSFIQDLIKRAEIRARSEDPNGAASSTENDLLLGLLYIENKESDKAAEPFGRLIVAEPDFAESIGPLLVDLEREKPDNAELKFQLARTSILLAHPDKAEVRLFQCLELADPPLDRILETLDEAPQECENHLLLKGELLIRLGRAKEGVGLVRTYIGGPNDRQPSEEGVQHLFPAHKDREARAESRLRLLPEASFLDPDVVFLYCDVAAARGNAKRAADRLDALYRADAGHAERIISWFERSDDDALSGKAKKLLAEILISAGDYEKASAAARDAVEREKSLIPPVLELVRNAVESDAEHDSPLTVLLAELYARAGDGESASDVLSSLKDRDAIDDRELLDLSGQIMKHAGVNLSAVVSSVDAGIRSGSVVDSAPYVRALCSEHPECIDELETGLRKLAEEKEQSWQPIADLLDYISKEERLPKKLVFLRALAHLEAGAVEKAIFEFDQLLVQHGEMRPDLILVYERAAERFDTNATLHLALYQLHLEERQLPLAAHYLCRMIEIDPEQVKDVLQRFDKLVEMEPDNISIWEEMLKSALASNRTSLAREVLKRAIQCLPEEQSAALHIYGTRVSISDGNYDDALRCIAVALTGENADFRAIEEQLEHILMAAPKNQEARFLLGVTYLSLGREEHAVAAFKDCLSVSPAYADKIRDTIESALPASVKPWVLATNLAEIAWMQARREEAYRLFKNAQKGPRESLADLGRTLEGLYEKSPRDIRLALIYGRNLSLEGRYDESTALLGDLVSVDDSSSKQILEILFEMLDASPEHFEANRLLAQIATDSGDPGRSLESIVRILSHEEMNPEKLDEIVSHYSSFHERNSLFLIPYAGLKARRRDFTEALATYRKAIDIEGTSWSRVVEELERHSWPEELREESELLKIDCRIAGGDYEGVTDAIHNQRVENPKYARALAARLDNLINKGPKRKYFSIGGLLMARAGDFDEAERFFRRGCESLEGTDRTDLEIEFVEVLNEAGRFDRAAPIMEELISAATDKTSIYRSLERSYILRSEREIAGFSNGLSAAPPSAVESERIIRLCLDCGRPAEARELLMKTSLPPEMRTILLGEIYLAEERPATALALFGSTETLAADTDEGVRCLYAMGIAGEMLGDYGRARTAFAKILEAGREYRDSRHRAELNHTRFIESSLDEKALILEVIGSLEGLHEGVDEK